MFSSPGAVQLRAPGVCRAHLLPAQEGWEDVADYALDWALSHATPAAARSWTRLKPPAMVHARMRTSGSRIFERDRLMPILMEVSEGEPAPPARQEVFELHNRVTAS